MKISEKWIFGLVAILCARGLIFIMEHLVVYLNSIIFAYLLTFYSLVFYEVLVQAAKE